MSGPEVKNLQSRTRRPLESNWFKPSIIQVTLRLSEGWMLTQGHIAKINHISGSKAQSPQHQPEALFSTHGLVGPRHRSLEAFPGRGLIQQAHSLQLSKDPVSTDKFSAIVWLCLEVSKDASSPRFQAMFSMGFSGLPAL